MWGRRRALQVRAASRAKAWRSGRAGRVSIRKAGGTAPFCAAQAALRSTAGASSGAPRLP